MRVDEKALRRYLLGNTTDIETEELATRIISEPDFECDLAMAEESLIEDYLEKTLSEQEVESFQNSFAISDERIEQIQLIRGLRRIAVERQGAPLAIEEQNNNETESLVQKLRRLLSNKSPAFALAAVVLIVIAGLGWFALSGRNGTLTGLEKEYAVLNVQGFDDETVAGEKYRIDLVSGVSRGAGGFQEVVSKKVADRFLFVLALPTVPADSTFRIVVESGDKKLFEQRNLKVYDNKAGRELRVLLPVSILALGQHRIELRREDSEEDPEYYYFAVE